MLHGAGSPFHPKIVDPRAVVCVGGWGRVLDPTGGTMPLNLHQLNEIELDTSAAGPGHCLLGFVLFIVHLETVQLLALLI